jgi:phosphate-selective porin
LAARLEYLEFDSPNQSFGPNGQPVGSRTTTLTIGLGWYLNDNARIMLDWVHPIPGYPPFGSSPADPVCVRTAVVW